MMMNSTTTIHHHRSNFGKKRFQPKKKSNVNKEKSVYILHEHTSCYLYFSHILC